MSLNILIVEDEAITALDIKKKLEYWGYHTSRIAHTGLDAIKIAQEIRPDLILMDIVLKGSMDGIETANQIKDDLDIPVVYLTAHSEDKIMERAKYTEPYGYLIKPLDEKELRFALESAIYKHKLDKKLKKSNRALRMISDCNQAIARIKDQNTLLSEICKLIVEEGVYKLAWIGIAQDDEFKSVRPIAEFGFNEGYLNSLKISWDDNKYGQGPVGKAIRNSKPSISRNIQQDPDFIPWREKATKRGYNSIAALPLLIEDRVVGSLTIYSKDIDAFDSDELKLLQELSGDISFYLESKKLREKNLKALQNLKESEKTLKNVMNAAPFGAHVYELNESGDLIFKDYNESARKILGINHDPLIGKTIEEAFPGLINTEIPEIYKKIALNGGEYQEDRIEYDEKDITGIFDIKVVNTGKNKTTVFFRDITDSRTAQIALEKSEERFRLLAENSKDVIYRMSLPEGQYEYMSPAATELFGYTPEEFYQEPQLIQKIVHPQWTDYFQKKWNDLINGKMDPYYEFQIVDKQGHIKWIHQRNTLIQDKNGNLKYIQSVVTDLTEKKITEDQLKESENRYRQIFENATEGIYQSTPEGTYISLNPAFAQMAGYGSPKEMMDTVKNIAEIYVDPLQREVIKKILKEEGVLKDFPAQIYCKDGSKIWISIYAKAVNDAEGNVLYYEGTTQDITEKKLMEDALIESEQKYRNIVESANEGIWAMDKNFKTTFVNQQMADMLGYSSDEVMNKVVTDFMFEEELPKHEKLMKNRYKGLNDKYQRKFRRKDGSKLWALVSATALKDGNGDFNGSFAMLTDITYEKEYAKQLKRALKEKELLLSEIHHRVKNNMQIITSLLSLQKSYLNDEKDLDLFTESQNRVKSLALVHEKVYRSKDLTKIDLADYIKDLAYYLFYSYIDNPEKIKLDFNLIKVRLNIETVIPCGIILNELVTNCLKHAFPSPMSGKININLNKENDEFILVICDNGKGFPEEIDFRNTPTLGMHLVMSLVDQIDGTIEMDRTTGTSFKIKFKELNYEQKIKEILN